MKRLSINLFGSVAVMGVLSLLWFPAPACGAGAVTGWGGNNAGQISPCASNVVAIAAGYEHSLLLKEDGTVAACGAYPYYDGQGHYYDISVIVPPDLTNVVAVSAGDSHSLALNAEGTVVAWGISTDGQTNVPPDLTNVVAISAGAKHSLALKADGTVVGWGTSGTNVPSGLTNAVAIAGGRGNSLVLKADGTVAGWGYFGFGNGQTNLAGLSNIVAISAADNCCYESWLALQANGVVMRGDAFGGTSSLLSNVVAISASRGTDQHISLALMADGTVAGILGHNMCCEPIVPPGLTNVVAVAAGDGHNLALVGDGPPVLQAPLLNPAWDANGFKVFIPTQNGRVYRLEYKNSLADGDWVGLPLIAGNGGLQTLSDPTATGVQRFYRARRW